MIGRLLICLLATAFVLVAAPVTAVATDPAPADSATAPKTSLAELEDEVMCPVCGTLLGLSQAPQADRQRVLIERLIDQGLTKEEIKDRLVAEYGSQVLALPEGSGFNLTAYLVPVIGLGLAAAVLFGAVWRWRRETDAGGGEATTADGPGQEPGAGGGDDLLDDEEAGRLDKDLARYDF